MLNVELNAFHYHKRLSYPKYVCIFYKPNLDLDGGFQ